MRIKDQEIWDRYVLQGQTSTTIGKELGIKPDAVFSAVQRVRESIPQGESQFVVDRRIGQINATVETLLPQVLQGDKEAIASWMKLLEREARYLGLDSAKRVELSGGVRYEIVMDDD